MEINRRKVGAVKMDEEAMLKEAMSNFSKGTHYRKRHRDTLFQWFICTECSNIIHGREMYDFDDFGNTVYLKACDCGNEFFNDNIDNDVIPILRIFKEKSIKTQFSCSGHVIFEDREDYTSGYKCIPTYDNGYVKFPMMVGVRDEIIKRYPNEEDENGDPSNVYLAYENKYIIKDKEIEYFITFEVNESYKDKDLHYIVIRWEIYRDSIKEAFESLSFFELSAELHAIHGILLAKTAEILNDIL